MTTVDYSLGQKYIKNFEKKNLLKEWPSSGYLKKIINKKLVKGRDSIWEFVEEVTKYQEFTGKDYYKWLKLADKIEENCELFAQLDYLLRKTNPDDVRNGHIKLLTQYIRLQEPSYNEDKNFLFRSTHPLFYVGYRLNPSFQKPYIITNSKKLSPICYLIHELCCDVGLDVPLIITKLDEDDDPMEWFEYDESKLSCRCIITDSSNLTAAVNTLIEASTTAPWRISELWVHSDVVKTMRNVASDINSNRFCWNKEQKSDTQLFVNIYETDKKLMELIRWPNLLSVWGDDYALATEIAHRSSAYYVWINSHGDFTGPPKAALPFYNHRWYTETNISHNDTKKINKISRTWTKLDNSKRFDIVLKTLRKSKSYKNDSNLKKIYKGIQRWTPDDIVHKTNNRIVSVVHKEESSVTVTSCPVELDVIKTVIAGNSLLIYSDEEYILELSEAGVPLFRINDFDYNDDYALSEKYHLPSIKVINVPLKDKLEGNEEDEESSDRENKSQLRDSDSGTCPSSSSGDDASESGDDASESEDSEEEES